MAAYAAITSLMRAIEQSMQLSDAIKLELFYEKLESMRAIHENPLKVTGDLASLELEITEVASTAEQNVDIQARYILLSRTTDEQTRYSCRLHSLVEKVVGQIDSATTKWMEILQNMNMCNEFEDVRAQDLAPAATNISHHKNVMVGREGEFGIIKDQLANGGKELQVISIVGMGGIGKTTLAMRLYTDPFALSHYDYRLKATVSQEYSTRNVLLGLLSSISEEFEEEDDSELAEQLQKTLKCGRYLVLIDDIWTPQAWDDVRLCFPDCGNGSRILLTTRNMEVAQYASSGNPPQDLRLLSFAESWSLFKVFVKQFFSPEHEQIGEQIVRKCGGLPLTIVVVAGLVSRIGETLDEWQSVAADITSPISTDVQVQCMRVLASSYHHLPQHLKLCFLYFSIFPEDTPISVNQLIRYWTAEGFVKVEKMKDTEMKADECLRGLMDRNLVSIHQLSFDGKVKTCGMHDMIHELCLTEARNMNFVIFTARGDDEQNMSVSAKAQVRISFQSDLSPSYNFKRLSEGRYTKARSVFLFYKKPSNIIVPFEMPKFPLLRFLKL